MITGDGKSIIAHILWWWRWWGWWCFGSVDGDMYGSMVKCMYVRVFVHRKPDRTHWPECGRVYIFIPCGDIVLIKMCTSCGLRGFDSRLLVLCYCWCCYSTSGCMYVHVCEHVCTFTCGHTNLLYTHFPNWPVPEYIIHTVQINLLNILKHWITRCHITGSILIHYCDVSVEIRTIHSPVNCIF